MNQMLIAKARDLTKEYRKLYRQQLALEHWLGQWELFFSPTDEKALALKEAGEEMLQDLRARGDGLIEEIKRVLAEARSQG